MAIGSGLGSQLSIAAESAYGTFVAPSKHLEFTKESLQLKKVTAQSQGIAANRLLARSARRVVTQRSGGGNVDIEVVNKGMGAILQALMGTTVTPVQQGATPAYLQTHLLADVFGKSLTIQKGVPLTTGAVTDKTFVGCKILSAEFSCEVGGMLTLSLEIDAKNCDETQTLAVASYSNMSPFNFSQMGVKLGSYGTETARDGIRKVSLKFERGQATERYYAGASGLKAEPISNALVKITGSYETDYVDTQLDDQHTSDAASSLVWEFLGPQISGAFVETIRFKIPAFKINDGPPVVDGYDIVKPTYNFEGLDDGTNPVAIEYMSTDVTL
ncbi:phage tail tube protein [Streptomyces phaeochromogenes]|uniref:phage tail tube protein n=1 Tax=Streptomyces phaeochromogenes TaxID=1923 RepID=UPI0036B49E2F